MPKYLIWQDLFFFFHKDSLLLLFLFFIIFIECIFLYSGGKQPHGITTLIKQGQYNQCAVSKEGGKNVYNPPVKISTCVCKRKLNLPKNLNLHFRGLHIEFRAAMSS